MTIIVPMTSYDDGSRGPDLSGLSQAPLTCRINPDGASYTCVLPPAREVSLFRFRYVCAQEGLVAQIEAALAALPGDAGALAREAWSSSPVVRRDSPTLARLAQGLGLSDAQVDGLFDQAEALVV